MTRKRMNSNTIAKTIGALLSGLLFCSPVMAMQSRVAKPSGQNAKAPATSAKSAAVTTSKKQAAAVTKTPTAPAAKTAPPARVAVAPAPSRQINTVPTPAKPSAAKTVVGTSKGGKLPTTTVASIGRPSASSTASDATAVATTGPGAAIPPGAGPSPEALAQSIVDLANGKIPASEFSKRIAGENSNEQPPAAPSAQIAEITRLTIEAANQALAVIPGQKTTPFAGTLQFVKTDWDGLFSRANGNDSMQQMLAQFRALANQAGFKDITRYQRPMTLAEIPADLVDGRLSNVPLDRRSAFGLAMVDCAQTSWLASNGVTLAVVAKSTRDPEQLSRAVGMLEELSKYTPLQRPGTTIWDPNVPVTAGGEGVWLATAWGISAIVDISSALGEHVPVNLRDRLRLQLREEVQRICVDWRDARPWFVKSRYVVSNQWIEPSIALIKACLFLGDPALLPAYNLGVENLLASLNAHGVAGEFLEGVSYAEMSLMSTHEIIGKMRLNGDTRTISTHFAKNNWRWFAQMHLPGAMLVNCNDSGRSEVPDYCMTVPFSSFGAAAIASGSDDAIAMLRFMYPSPKPIGALEALKYADYLASSSVPANITLPTFQYFPGQQMVVWRSEFQPVAAPQTALALWMKGGTTSENHVRREQGNLSIYCGDRVVLSNCGTPYYSDPAYATAYANAAGSNIMQVDQLPSTGHAVNAPLFVNSLNASGGSVTIDTSAAYVGATCTRDITWNIAGSVRIDDRARLGISSVAGQEFYRFHTGSAESLTISGAGKSWTISWRGASMTITADKNIRVEQATKADKLQAPFHHQAILISVPTSTDSLYLTTELLVDRSITQ